MTCNVSVSFFLHDYHHHQMESPRNTFPHTADAAAARSTQTNWFPFLCCAPPTISDKYKHPEMLYTGAFESSPDKYKPPTHHQLLLLFLGSWAEDHDVSCCSNTNIRMSLYHMKFYWNFFESSKAPVGFRYPKKSGPQQQFKAVV